MEIAKPKMCHRHGIPVSYVAVDQSQLRPSAREVAKFAHVACSGKDCMLWNPDSNECYDVTQAKSIKSLESLSRISNHS